jgi:hypothetical protein
MDPKTKSGTVQPERLFRRPTSLASIFGSLSVRVCRNLLVCADLSYADSVAAIDYLSWSGKFKMATVISGQARNAIDSDNLSRLRDPLRNRKNTVVTGVSAQLASLDVHQRLDPVELILEKARRHSRRRRLPVLLLGTATDIAAAMQKDESLSERIEVIASGFAGWPEGGLPECSDVAAWQMLLDSDIPITFAGSDASKMNLPLTNALLANHFSPPPQSPDQSSAQPLRLNAHGDEPLALSGLLAAAYLAVGGQATAYRRPVLNNEGNFLHGNGTDPLPCQTCASEPRVHWIKTINSATFLTQFQRALAAAEKNKV